MKRNELIDGLSSKSFKALQDLHNMQFNPIEKNLIKELFKQRPASGHKGTFGHALIIAGNRGTSGAAILASKAALRTGCGLLTTSTHADGFLPLLAVLPEAMTRVRHSAQDVRNLDLNEYDAIGFGPGAGTGQVESDILLYLLKNYKGPLVIDADGLTILGRHEDMYELVSDQTILTPHPGEFARISVTGSDRNDLIHAQLNFHKKYKSTILVKGRNTTVVTNKGLFYNTTGNNGMATAGSGDVLTGIITSLCAQDYSPGDAAVMGTFLHGFAGDVAAKRTSYHSLIASDIIDEIKTFFQKFEVEV